MLRLVKWTKKQCKCTYAWKIGWMWNIDYRKYRFRNQRKHNISTDIEENPTPSDHSTYHDEKEDRRYV